MQGTRIKIWFYRYNKFDKTGMDEQSRDSREHNGFVVGKLGQVSNSAFEVDNAVEHTTVKSHDEFMAGVKQ